jgi:hypothetical protein
MEEEEMIENHKLAILVNALNSTISFVMETLVQHREMVGQLQDEVTVLRSQLGELQLRTSPLNSSSGLTMDILPKREVTSVPDLNVPTINPNNEDDEVSNDRPSIA